MHITAEDIVVEIIDSEQRVPPRAGSGEIVEFTWRPAITLYPVMHGRCRCPGELPAAAGAGLPILSEIQGGATDFVIAADGTVHAWPVLICSSGYLASLK